MTLRPSKGAIADFLAKRMECVKLASALKPLRKRKQASPTPYAWRRRTSRPPRNVRHKVALKALLGTSILLLAISCCSLQIAMADTGPHPDRILIKPKRLIPLERLAAFHQTSLAKVAQEFPNFGGIQVIDLPPGETIEAAIADYLDSGLVEYAEP